MNIFITGINGFIGSSLARYLLEKGHRISGSVRRTSDLSFLKDQPVQLFTGDISDESFLVNCFKDHHIVYHIAALASDWAPHKTFHRINVQGTMNAAKAALRSDVKRFVYVSSTAVYGLSGYRNRTEESAIPSKNFHYASTKRDAEVWLRRFAQETKLPITIVQPANVFGPYDRTFFIKFADAVEKKMMTYVSGGKAWTCPTYIENLVDALWLAATKPEAIGETFIVSDGLEINWKQFIEKICQQLQVPKPRISINFYIAYSMALIMEGIYKLLRLKATPAITRYRICNVGRDYHFSIEKARNVLGYSPQIHIDEAIRRTVEWYKNFKMGNR